MRLPLYRSVREAYEASLGKDRLPRGASLALVFDKFADTRPDNNCKPSADKDEQQYKRAFLERFAGRPIGDGALLTDHVERRRKLVESLGGRTLPASSEWRFVSGLGAAHPFETGFVWHHTLSVPYLPGSSVKAMMRAWARIRPEAKEVVDELFGTQAGAGRLVVFDALPTRLPTLDLDLLNVHYPGYYRGSGPAGDYLSPNPVYFLTVAPGSELEFALAPRPGTKGADLGKGLELLGEALSTLGAGARTSSGYGRFVSKAELTSPAQPVGTAVATSDGAVERVRAQVQAWTGRDMGRIGELVGRIERLPGEGARRELAMSLLNKIPEKERRKRQDKTWLKRLLAMKGEGE